MTDDPTGESRTVCPACDSPSPLVRLLIQRPCDHAWHVHETQVRDMNDPMVFLHEHCKACGRWWIAACAPSAVEIHVNSPGPCMGGVVWPELYSLRGPDTSAACMSHDISVVVGRTMPWAEAMAALREGGESGDVT